MFVQTNIKFMFMINYCKIHNSFKSDIYSEAFDQVHNNIIIIWYTL